MKKMWNQVAETILTLEISKEHLKQLEELAKMIRQPVHVDEIVSEWLDTFGKGIITARSDEMLGTELMAPCGHTCEEDVDYDPNCPACRWAKEREHGKLIGTLDYQL